MEEWNNKRISNKLKLITCLESKGSDQDGMVMVIFFRRGLILNPDSFFRITIQS